MDLLDVHFKLPDPMLRAAARVSRRADISVGQLMRIALDAEIRKRSKGAKTPDRAQEQLLASLRRLLATDLAEASDWQDLKTRLETKGFALREAGGGLALHSHPDGARVCKASELGYAYGILMKRFGAPFPGHRHAHLVRRLLPDPETEIDVIERG